MEQSKKQNLKTELLSWGKTLAVAVVLALTFNNFLVVNASIPSSSMENTVMTGDRVLCNRLAYLGNDPERYDIVVFRNHNGDSPKYLFKRVIGLPGETLEIRGGKVYVDGGDQPLQDDFIAGPPSGDFGPYEIPAGCYFMMGDNRSVSEDSRRWPAPYVPRENILGKAVFTYYPHMHMLEDVH